MNNIIGVSALTSFIAGSAALFAPCCITVLLPAYLASAFREKKNILKMTLIFFSGIAVVLIPIGLGVAALAQVFQNYHTEMYIIGGLLMIAFATLSVFGKGLAVIPMTKRVRPGADLSHPKSVFLLGIFSGAATSCCAPVLAGAVTLAVISGAFWKALIVTFAYVFGMVFPLFLASRAPALPYPKPPSLPDHLTNKLQFIKFVCHPERLAKDLANESAQFI